jgi:hypothetical protein
MIGKFITERWSGGRDRATSGALMLSVARLHDGSHLVRSTPMVGLRFVVVDIYCDADEVAAIAESEWFLRDLPARRADASRELLVTFHVKVV